MSHHIKPTTIEAYLSGVCNQLERVFPNVRDIRKSRIVARTLVGCKKLYCSEERRKRALTRTGFRALHPADFSFISHDDALLCAILLTGFHMLKRLALHYHQKIVRQSSHFTPSSSYLPGHKADRLFEDTRVLLEHIDALNDPYTALTHYLKSRDTRLQCHGELLLRADGTVPTRCCFMRRLRYQSPTYDVAADSRRSGEATFMAEAGVPLHLIQKTGRWAFSAFKPCPSRGYAIATSLKVIPPLPMIWATRREVA